MVMQAVMATSRTLGFDPARTAAACVRPPGKPGPTLSIRESLKKARHLDGCGQRRDSRRAVSHRDAL
jgi:hypothetical protein